MIRRASSPSNFSAAVGPMLTWLRFYIPPDRHPDILSFQRRDEQIEFDWRRTTHAWLTTGCETFRTPAFIPKRTIRVPDEEGWNGVRSDAPQIRCKKRFYVFILVTFFCVFNVFFNFPNLFYLKKNVGKVQSGKQINKKHFQNNSNEIDLWFFCCTSNDLKCLPINFY